MDQIDRKACTQTSHGPLHEGICYVSIHTLWMLLNVGITLVIRDGSGSVNAEVKIAASVAA